jgi:hypothetical protein
MVSDSHVKPIPTRTVGPRVSRPRHEKLLRFAAREKVEELSPRFEFVSATKLGSETNLDSPLRSFR